MITLQDQIGAEISLSAPARRIVSLVPSQTELLYDLGLEDEVAGITRFCVLPAHWHKAKPRIGGTKDVDIEKLASLKPDLVIANKEENIREQAEAIRLFCPVWTSDISDLASALQMIEAVGTLCGRERQAGSILREISAGFEQLPSCPVRPRCLYLVWKDPLMTAGGDTFIHDMISKAGFENAAAHLHRYPTLTEGEASALNPAWVLLSSEPYPFRERHMDAVRAIFPGAKVLLVDGMCFSWYGSRLRHAPAYFAGLRGPTGKLA